MSAAGCVFKIIIQNNLDRNTVTQIKRHTHIHPEIIIHSTPPSITNSIKINHTPLYKDTYSHSTTHTDKQSNRQRQRPNTDTHTQEPKIRFNDTDRQNQKATNYQTLLVTHKHNLTQSPNHENHSKKPIYYVKLNYNVKTLGEAKESHGETNIPILSILSRAIRNFLTIVGYSVNCAHRLREISVLRNMNRNFLY